MAVRRVASGLQAAALTRAIGWADKGSPSFAIDGLRTSAHPIVLTRGAGAPLAG